MKKNTTSRTYMELRPLPYPNAAEPNYFLNKIVDGLLAAATTAGTFTILFFLITM